MPETQDEEGGGGTGDDTCAPTLPCRAVPLYKIVMRILAFALGLALLLSMGLGGAAHASEFACAGAEQMQSDHSDGTPSDSDSGPAHIHGCHGHHVATPTSTPHNVIVRPIVAPVSAREPFHLPGAGAGPQLRPPQA